MSQLRATEEASAGVAPYETLPRAYDAELTKGARIP